MWAIIPTLCNLSELIKITLLNVLVIVTIRNKFPYIKSSSSVCSDIYYYIKSKNMKKDAINRRLQSMIIWSVIYRLQIRFISKGKKIIYAVSINELKLCI